METIQKGDSVKFNLLWRDIFIQETSNGNEEVKKYQKLVLAGIEDVAIVQEVGKDLTTVLYEDGWELPIPTRYLVVVS